MIRVKGFETITRRVRSGAAVPRTVAFRVVHLDNRRALLMDAAGVWDAADIDPDQATDLHPGCVSWADLLEALDVVRARAMN